MIYPIRHSLLLGVILSCLLFSALAEECHDTHMEFFSEYSLGKQDELNRTFIKIQDRVPTINAVHWTANDSASYSIENMKVTYHYLDSTQMAEIVSNNTIIVKGGKLEATIDFTWRRTGSTSESGSGRAIGITDEIVFAKTFEISEDGYIEEKLIDYWNVTFSQSSIRIVRIEPPTTPQEDIANLNKLFNDILNVTTVRHELEDQIDKVFFYYLKNSLYDERRHLDDHFVYEWHNRDTLQNATIEFKVKPTFVDVEKAGVTLFEIAHIADWAGWKCEYHGPKNYLNPKIYGGRQQFISFDIYKNLILYGIEKKLLDTELNRKNWESRFFQFFAGDLYEVIPKLAPKYLASDIAVGNCKATPSGFEIIKGTHESINVTINYDCELNINSEKVAQFRINLGLEAHGRASEKTLDFHIIAFNHTTSFTEYQGYKVENLDLAQHMVTHSLNRLLQGHVFGSGWPLYPRDYPHFIVEDNYTVVYDSTHVDTSEEEFKMIEKLFEEELEMQYDLQDE